MVQAPSKPHRVVVAGGGVAGLEAILALRAHAGPRVSVLLVEPQPEFTVRADAVHTPFGGRPAQRLATAQACEDTGTELVPERLVAVDADARIAITSGGRRLAYDSLLVAVGADARAALPHVTTFRGPEDTEAMHGVLQDLEEGWSRRIAFVVPPRVTWSLPIYDLALQTAERAYGLCLDDAELTIVTCESAPLEHFGTRASATVAGILAANDIRFVGGAYVQGAAGGLVRIAPAPVVVEADRVVALPRLHARRIPGLDADADGFLRVDVHGRVAGSDGVYAAGDGTASPVKQGGLAAQQADAAAQAIAADAGVDIRPEPFRPRLRGKLFAGRETLYLRNELTGGVGDGESLAAAGPMWSPDAKVGAPYLAPYLRDHARRTTGGPR